MHISWLRVCDGGSFFLVYAQKTSPRQHQRQGRVLIARDYAPCVCLSRCIMITSKYHFLGIPSTAVIPEALPVPGGCEVGLGAITKSTVATPTAVAVPCGYEGCSYSSVRGALAITLHRRKHTGTNARQLCDYLSIYQNFIFTERLTTAEGSFWKEMKAFVFEIYSNSTAHSSGFIGR